MAKHARLILTRDGERAFGHLADSIATNLDRLLREEEVKKKQLAEKANVDQAVLSRVLDGSRNLEIRTIGALFGALGYVLDVVPRRISAPQPPRGNPPDNEARVIELRPAPRPLSKPRHNAPRHRRLTAKIG